MKHNRPNPPVTVVPVLVYPDVRAAVDWLTAAFGCAERVRIGESQRAQMSIGADGAVIGRRCGRSAVRVDDVGAQFERARAAGARVLEPPTDREYGEHEFTVEDLAGHRWQFSETLRDVSPEEFECHRFSPWPART